jgi:hypothetical protein
MFPQRIPAGCLKFLPELDSLADPDAFLLPFYQPLDRLNIFMGI